MAAKKDSGPAKKRRARPYTEEEKALVEYLKDKLKARGVTKFPRDWHLKQLSVARTMLDGDQAPTVEQWKGCIDWAFSHPYWGDKIDHLARISWLWTQYVLRGHHKKAGDPDRERRRQLLKSLYLS